MQLCDFEDVKTKQTFVKKKKKKSLPAVKFQTDHK